MCEAKMTNEVKVNDPNEVKVNEQQFLGELTSNTTDSCCAVVAVMGSSAEVGDVFFKLDTGASVSVIAYKEPILKRVKLVNSDKVLMGPGQATLDVLGQYYLRQQSSTRMFRPKKSCMSWMDKNIHCAPREHANV